MQVFDPKNGLWGKYPYMDKPTMGQSPKKFAEIEYAQGALNFLGFKDSRGNPLTVDGQFGKKTYSALMGFQAVERLATTGILDQPTWQQLDYLAYNEWKQAPKSYWRIIPLPNGTAITVGGLNRHTKEPVNGFGLTREAARLGDGIRTIFPASPTKQNYAVDRAIRGGTALSDHARGEALDMMVPGFDGNKANISAADRAYGRAVMAWIVDHAQGPLHKGLRDKFYRGPYRISYVLFDGWIWYAQEDNWPEGTDDPNEDLTIKDDAEWLAYCVANEVRRLKPTSNQHRDHVHVSIVPVDRT